MWQQWTNFVLGLGVAIVPFLGMTTEANTWTLLVAGLAIAGFSMWGAQETNAERESGKMVHRTQH